MLFNSIVYLFAFLPLMVLGYYLLLTTKKRVLVNLWLVTGSLFFYSYWLPEYLPLILASIVFNFLCSKGILGFSGAYSKKIVLGVGCLFNVGLLAYFKYADFFIENVAIVFGVDDPTLLHLALPLGISFFTFQQIAFLVDSYVLNKQDYNFINYALFVSFFPQLIAGPIVHHKEMMPQFDDKENAKVRWDNIYVGLFFISIGLFKKVGVADTFAVWVNQGFASADSLSLWEGWRTSISYTIQLYFDFSGYTDMAIGSARLFNIVLPLNFNSPYRALHIQDFWRRWHMTLSRFLRDYVYIPLGGNRGGSFFICRNLFLTFLIGGIWHGAGWTFIVWGALHGVAVVIHRLWSRAGYSLPKPAAWFVTIFFVNIAWVYFRAPDIASAHSVLSAMFSLSFDPLWLAEQVLANTTLWQVQISTVALMLFVIADVGYRNSQQWAQVVQPGAVAMSSTVFMFWIGAFLLMQENRFSEFLYFQF